MGGLSFIGLLASIISLLFKAFVILFEDFEFGVQLVSWVNSVDSLVNFLVLFFQYGFAAEYYYFWCRCIDHGLVGCIEKKADNAIMSQHEYTQTAIDDVSDSSRRLNHIGNESVELDASSD